MPPIAPRIAQMSTGSTCWRKRRRRKKRRGRSSGTANSGPVVKHRNVDEGQRWPLLRSNVDEGQRWPLLRSNVAGSVCVREDANKLCASACIGRMARVQGVDYGLWKYRKQKKRGQRGCDQKPKSNGNALHTSGFSTGKQPKYSLPLSRTAIRNATTAWSPHRRQR